MRRTRHRRESQRGATPRCARVAVGAPSAAAASPRDPTPPRWLAALSSASRRLDDATPTPPRGRPVRGMPTFRPPDGREHADHQFHRRPTPPPTGLRQRRSRSARTWFTAAPNDTLPPLRAATRSKTSSSVGWLASAIRRLRRYSCNDWCARAARSRKTLWVSSGTSFICTLGMAPFWRCWRQNTTAAVITCLQTYPESPLGSQEDRHVAHGWQAISITVDGRRGCLCARSRHLHTAVIRR